MCESDEFNTGKYIKYILKLLKENYGLNQTYRAFRKHLRKLLQTLRGRMSPSAPTAFFFSIEGTFIFEIFYVDELVIAGERETQSTISSRTLENILIFV